MEETIQSNLFDLQVDHQSSAYLGETAKWAKFLAIIGFIFCGIIVIAAFFVGAVFSSSVGNAYGAGSAFGAMGGVGVAVMYILFGLLYFFPCLYLFKFASKMKVALKSNDQLQLNESFRNLKSCFKFIGILTIIAIAIWLLAIIIGLFAASAALH